MLGSSRRMLSTPCFRRLMPKFIRWCTRLGGARYGAGRGQVFPIMAGGLFVLIGFVGMAFDLGIARNARRQMQNAADAAAIAAAQALGNGQDYSAAASQAAAQNGFTSGQSTPLSSYPVSITTATPSGGSYSGDAEAIQVTLSQLQQTYFLRVLGINSLATKASAVGYAKSGTACIYSLDPSGGGAISMNGNITVNSACGILVDSTSTTGLSVIGNVNITDTFTGVVGNYSSNGNVSFTPTPNAGIAAFADPLAGVPAPSVPTCTQAASSKSGSLSVTTTQTISPNVYATGVAASGNFGTVTLNGGTWGNGITTSGNGALVLNPGQYQNGGGSGNSLTVNGNTTVTMTPGQYTFCGPVNLNGNTATATLSPGFYYGGISINGNQAIVFNPGLYILGGGGLSINGNTSTMTGTGVTFYNTTGLSGYKTIKLNGNTQENLSAPTSGSLQGILFFQDRSIPTSGAGSIINGNSASTFDGALYFPTTDVTYNGNSSLNGYTILVAYDILWNGNSTVGNNYTSLAGGSPIKSGLLVQ
jgi:hypothetical protein